MNYKCPDGHDVTKDDTDTAPICHVCDVIATHYNAKTGHVYTWTPLVEHEKDCERIQDAMDDAFDNTYFAGGW